MRNGTRNRKTRNRKTRKTRSKGGNPQEMIGINYIEECHHADMDRDTDLFCNPNKHDKISIKEIKVKVKQMFGSSYELYNITNYTFECVNDHVLAKLRTNPESYKKILYTNISSVTTTHNTIYEIPYYTFGLP
jgi:hypothetical protein